MEGSLSKWTNVMKGWQYRWFVLDDNSGLLSYYTSKEKMMRGVRRGCVRLKGAVIGIDDEDDSTFTITVDHKTFHFQARDAEEREKWVRALEDAIFRHGSRMKWNNHQPPPTIKDFESKVSEADAYLQLLIEQTRNLEERTASMSDNEEKTMCQCIIEHANSMLDNVKHSIVLLQIAKNTAHPVNGLGLYTKLNTGDAAGADCIVHSNLDFTASCLENGHRHALSIGPAGSALIVPDMSYSSSEGEEDFFDANDYPSSASQLPTPMGLKNSFEGEHPETEASKRTSRTPSIPSLSKSLQGIDIDAIYEEEDDENLEMECHGSVVRHLLSQVKIGMDLTKVVLPTFILERRSLLEMYADFFAHPDIFLNIVDFKDPKQRMVQVLKWYLSSYHAGKKSAVAKKPYNPVLGEIFRCFWNVPGTTSRRNSTPTNPTGGHAHKTEEHVADGPVPWCTKEQLCFIAEQVSHHPPISAFYGEHFNKRISFNAHIYTKSKFLGLSVCVHNLGEGRISVLDYDEEYIVTFPVGYGRSILTVPWIELGGPATVNCPKTGYHCNIEFITKPFYGNKKHRIVAEAYGPEDNKKPFLTVTGEWNGLMEAKWSDEKETEKFVDVRELDIVKKQVKAVGKQEENESRRLWKEVTAGLKFNNIEKATNAKQYLEQKQRDEAKERSDSGIEWQTKLFQKGPEESWHYKNPLKLRINKPSNS